MVDFQASLMFDYRRLMPHFSEKKGTLSMQTITHFFPIQSWTLWKITTGNIFCQRVSSLILLPYFYIFLVFIIFHDWELFFLLESVATFDVRKLAAGSQMGPDPAAIHRTRPPLQSCPIPTGLPDGLGECWGVHATENWCTNIYIYINYTYRCTTIWVKQSGPGDPIFWSFFWSAVFVLVIW